MARFKALRTKCADTATSGNIARQGIVVEILIPRPVPFFALCLSPVVGLGISRQPAVDPTSQRFVLTLLLHLAAIPSDSPLARPGRALAPQITLNDVRMGCRPHPVSRRHRPADRDPLDAHAPVVSLRMTADLSVAGHSRKTHRLWAGGHEQTEAPCTPERALTRRLTFR